MYQEFQGIEIKVLSSCVPKGITGNDTFVDLLSPQEIRIFEKTAGIVFKRISL